MNSKSVKQLAGVISIKGEDGAPGQDGNEGEIGVQGIPGPKKTLISILSSNNCPNGGYSFEIGTDDNSDNVLTDEVTLVTDICNGEVGLAETGAQGPQGLMATMVLTGHKACW